MRFFFAVESTLGKLARLLRMAGFDARLDSGLPDPQSLAALAHPNGLILTRTKRVFESLAPGRSVMILANDPDQQMRDLFHRLGIRRPELKPLTRCILCNVELIETPQERLAGRLPDYVRQNHSQFRHCARCHRLYWPGSHASRMLAHVDAWFNPTP